MAHLRSRSVGARALARSGTWLVLLLGSSVPVQAQGKANFPGRLFTAGEYPVAAAMADLNVDGIVDLASVSTIGSMLHVYHGDSAGSFTHFASHPVDAGPIDLAVGDFSGDGTPDAVVACFNAGKVNVFISSSGGFSTAATHSTGVFPRAVALGDVDGDGLVDVVVANEGSNDVMILRNVGAGSLTNAGSYAMVNGPRDVLLVDLDSDGDLDLATANASSNDVSVRRSQGGTFGAAKSYAVGSKPSAIVAGDFDGDGRVDLATADHDSGTTTLLLRSVSGGFAAGSAFPAGPNPYHLIAADWTGDSRLDLLVANESAATVSLLAGSASGGFDKPTAHIVGGGPRFLASFDLNGDLRPDVAAVCPGSKGVTVLLGKGTGGLSGAISESLGWDCNRVTLADLDQDGRPDAVTANSTSGNVSSLMGIGLGGFGTVRTYALGPDIREHAIGDLDGDGFLDIVTASAKTNDLYTMLGDGSGGFGALKTFSSLGPCNSVSLADLDGDLVLDAVTCTHPGAMRSLRGNGMGGFTVAGAWVVGGPADSVSIADLNLDGRLDCATNMLDGHCQSHGSGNGKFQSIGIYPGSFPATPTHILAADVTLDGQADVVGAMPSLGSIGVLRSTGTGGHYLSAQSISAGGPAVFCLFGDVDGDLIPDLVTANEADDSISVLLGTATWTGAYGSPQRFAVADRPTSVDAADMNGDGFLDLVVTCRGAKALVILMQEPSGGPVCLPTLYCTAKVNSAGCAPAITAWGSPSSSPGSSFVIGALDVLSNKFGVLFYSKAGPASIPFQGGTLCVLPPLVRTSLQNSGGSGLCRGTFGFDFNAYVASGKDPALVAGKPVWAQYWSRDPGFAPPDNTSLSDALAFTLCP
jgi:hypothetical protein